MRGSLHRPVPVSVVRVLCAAAVGFVCFAWVLAIGGPTALRERWGWSAPLVSLLVHIAVEMTPIGNLIPFGIANGTLYGPWAGALLSWMGWMAATVLQSVLVRRDRHGVKALLPVSRQPDWLARFPVGHPFVLILDRWLPGGAYVVNLGASALGVPLTRLLMCAAIASAPPALLLAQLGARLVAE